MTDPERIQALRFALGCSLSIILVLVLGLVMVAVSRWMDRKSRLDKPVQGVYPGRASYTRLTPAPWPRDKRLGEYKAPTGRQWKN